MAPDPLTCPLYVVLQTQGVLLSLPEDMRHTLTRPGVMHTLPRPLQDVLLPPSVAVAASGQEAAGSRRRRRLAGAEGLSGGVGGSCVLLGLSRVV